MFWKTKEKMGNIINVITKAINIPNIKPDEYAHTRKLTRGILYHYTDSLPNTNNTKCHCLIKEELKKQLNNTNFKKWKTEKEMDVRVLYLKAERTFIPAGMSNWLIVSPQITQVDKQNGLAASGWRRVGNVIYMDLRCRTRQFLYRFIILHLRKNFRTMRGIDLSCCVICFLQLFALSYCVTTHRINSIPNQFCLFEKKNS